MAPPERAADDSPHVFWVLPLVPSGHTGELGEQHAHEPPLLLAAVQPSAATAPRCVLRDLGARPPPMARLASSNAGDIVAQASRAARQRSKVLDAS